MNNKILDDDDIIKLSTNIDFIKLLYERYLFYKSKYNDKVDECNEKINTINNMSRTLNIYKRFFIKHNYGKDIHNLKQLFSNDNIDFNLREYPPLPDSSDDDLTDRE